MRTVEQWLDEYGESHRNATNKTLHWICVPVIVVSLIGLLWSVPAPRQLAGDFAAAELGLAVSTRGRAVLPGDVVVAGGRHGVFVGAGLAVHRRAAKLAVAVVERVPRVVRGGMDRSVHRPSLRRQAAVVFQRHSVFDDRSAMVAELHLSKTANPILVSQAAAADTRGFSDVQSFFSRLIAIARVHDARFFSGEEIPWSIVFPSSPASASSWPA